MGKSGQNRFTSSMMHDKSNPSFKWARMLHLLDYHHWHYVKKVLPNKKHHEGNNNKDVQSHLEATNDPDTFKRSTKGTHEECKFQEHSTYSCLSTKSSSPNSSPRTKSSPSLQSSPSTKSSRATKIKKMIVREVTKRRGRHRRSSTCPVNSDLVVPNSAHNRLDSNDDGIADIENNEIPKYYMNTGQKTCGLCSTMKIRCQLGDKKQVGKGRCPMDHIDMLLQDNQDGSSNKPNYNKNIRRSASLQQSNELLDIMDVMSMNKRFFLRILDDPESSLRHNFFTQQDTSSTTRKSLMKSGTFPFNSSSSTKDNFIGVLNPSQNLTIKEHIHKPNMHEKSTALHDSQVPWRRFKDLRQKIKHVIKESKKDRHIIAMDAVLHKVPYGQKVPEESAKDSPCVGTFESDFSFSPQSTKDIRSYKRRSPSLDESLDRYCQLFETTSFGKEAKGDSHKTSKLRVMGGYSTRSDQKRLGRMFSSPDLQIYFSNQYENYDGDTPRKTFDRKVMSFSDKKVQDVVLNLDFEYKNKYNEQVRINSKNDAEQDGDANNMSIDNDKNTKEDTSNMIGDNINYFEVPTHENRVGSTTPEPHLMPNKESVTISILEQGVQLNKETTLEGSESMKKEITSQPEEMSNESPTFSCIKIDDDRVKTSFDDLSPSLRHVQVESDDIEEFNYVRDILQRSGYSGTELLGTWYSSEQPMDPSILVELESCQMLQPKFSLSKEVIYSNHLLLFDLINEILLAIYERSVSYWCSPLSSCSRIHPMPKGYHVLDEVWACINWYMSCSKLNIDPSLDYITVRDLAKDEKWMNLQFDAECVGLEVEDLIFEDLLNEVTS